MTANIPCNIKNFMALPLVLVHFHFYGIFVCVDCWYENIHRIWEFHGYIEMHEAFSLRSCVCVSVWKCRWNVNDNKYFECEQIPWINTHKQWQVVCIQNGPLSNDISNWKLNFNTRKCAMVCVWVCILPSKLLEKNFAFWICLSYVYRSCHFAVQVKFSIWKRASWENTTLFILSSVQLFHSSMFFILTITFH